MESPNRQAIKMLREQRKRKKRVVAFLCMASVVVVGTVIALRTSGRAMNNMVLDCVLSHDLPHQHSEECYYTPPEEGAQPVLVCGTADYVVHKHDQDDCYDKNGNLVCMLPEIEEHVHTEECYQEQKVLSCTLQEDSEGHIHSDSCYGPDYSAEPVCGEQETSGHTHTEDCYDEDDQLVCGLEESEGHTHDGSCYPSVQACGQEQGDGKHVHSDSCYTMELTATCGKREVQRHMHTEECYLHTVDQLDQAQTEELAEIGFDIEQVAFAKPEELPVEENRVLDQDGEPVLKCGQLQVLEHVHGDSCHKAVATTEDGLLSQLGSGNAGVDMPGQRTAVYQGASMRVTAIYEGEDFPENARVNVERMDEGGGLPEKQEQLSALMNSELQLKALLKVTVSGSDDVSVLSGPIRLTIEPAKEGKITAAAWYDSSADLADQGIYMQSGEAELKLLEVAQHESGAFTTEVYSGALVGIAQQAVLDGDGGIEQDGKLINISQSFVYEDEDYTMTFRIDGTATPKAEADKSGEDQDEPEYEPEDAETSETEDDEAADSASDDDNVYFTEPEDDGEAEPDAAEETKTEPDAQPESNNAVPGTIVTIAGDTLPANVLDDPEHPLGLLVEPVSEDSPEFETYSDYVLSDGSESGLPGMKVMSYELYYQGDELDISQCSVKLELTAKPKLINTAAEISDGSGEQAAPVAMAVLTADAVQEEAEAAEDLVVTVQTQEAGSIDRVLDEDGQAHELVYGCLNSSFDGSYSAVSLSKDCDSFEVMIHSVDDYEDDSQESGSTSDSKYFALLTITAKNPKFVVEYYALLKKVDDDTSGVHEWDKLTVIDTRKRVDGTGGLPVNGTAPNTITIAVDPETKHIKTKIEETKIYSDVETTFFQKPNLDYFSPGPEVEKNYTLKEIRVTYENKTEKTFGPNVILTNRIDLKNDQKYLYLEGDKTTIRLIYEPINNKTKDVDTDFFDYDISDGQHIYDDDVIIMNTGNKGYDGVKPQGINDPDNYVNVGTKTKYAFGNDNAGTGLGGLEVVIDRILNALNKANLNNSTRCTFGLVERYQDGQLCFRDNVIAPKNLFVNENREGNEGKTTIGKTSFSGTVQFKQYGDTYTLTKAEVTGGSSQDKLDEFGNPGVYDGNHYNSYGTLLKRIWTNNFWPMDGVYGDDIHFGEDSTTQMCRDGSTSTKRAGLPPSDDGTDHNSYFGMHFSVNFNLTQNYVGPLEYLFFGDDDMWVFLDGKLICDIGGVHSSVGEIVDLWDYINDGKIYATPEEKFKEHTLDFFYTERGASGSSCWMQFTLPSVNVKNMDPYYGSLQFTKTVQNEIVDGYSSPKRVDGDTDDEFVFAVKLEKEITDADGNPTEPEQIMSSFRYDKYNIADVDHPLNDKDTDDQIIDGSGEIHVGDAIYNGGCFTLKKDEYIVISNLPVGTSYTITEVGVLKERVIEGDKLKYILKDDNQYEAYDGEEKLENRVYTGTITKEGQKVEVVFNNVYKSYVLPKTGGSGTWGYVGVGSLLVLAAGCLLARKRIKKD